MNGTEATVAEPVTVIIRRRVKPGAEAAYEAWLQALQTDARQLPGYLGVTTQRPAPGGPRDYVSAVRFDSLANLQAFECSDLRREHVARLGDCVEGDAAWEAMTGLEFWFSPLPGTVVPQPSRPRMALVMVAMVFTLVIGSAVNAVFARLPFDTPYQLRLLVTIAIEVVLMTWWLMPLVTRRLARWIYPQRRAT